MGCLNDKEGFSHWFGNIHFSGPCNRSCYFCIGQHMMALDPLNNLMGLPKNINGFIDSCKERGVKEINFTGSNTDPLLYKNIPELMGYIEAHLGDVKFGIRTNGALIEKYLDDWKLFDKGSISITSLNPEIYQETMGQGKPPNLKRIIEQTSFPLKINMVMTPETVEPKQRDWLTTLFALEKLGIKTVNLREPYGQPHIGNPFSGKPEETRFGMPVYYIRDMAVTYWDVHYVEVESVNLYASGRISEDYPITKGHHKTGQVKEQKMFRYGRQVQQWIRGERVVT